MVTSAMSDEVIVCTDVFERLENDAMWDRSKSIGDVQPRQKGVGVVPPCKFKVLREKEVVLDHAIIRGEPFLGWREYIMQGAPVLQLPGDALHEQLIYCV
ncbi:hypothetical protein NPIL_433441 [Nephila pilipes]|uniref:Uncharacterized protein n=1 Tax=Nephila pilipes TaxID=299642 RepID=A0A8X6TF95_NEPPI|nr:hypothetical protein NPIL_433441 [Nephila pilipes]